MESSKEEQVEAPDFQSAADAIRRQEIARPAWIETPFGRRLICYADLTATGRHLPFVESLLDEIRPYYANTHTEVSTTGCRMTELREDARRIIREAVNASEEDELLFIGSGATAAVNKLVGLLGLRIPEPLQRAYDLAKHIPEVDHPIVFIGPYEHHSNELPWVESIAEVVEISLDAEGQIDLEDLAAQLHAYRDHKLKIGSFSSCSNVTGLLSDVEGIARLLHEHGAYAFFDYAASAPYVPIDMHPVDPEARIDAIFVSPHKFIGGPEASGVLIAHRELFLTRSPERPGGGTVDYVAGPCRTAIDYVADLGEREEGGTPAIMGDIRAGLAFLLKKVIGEEQIRDHEISIATAAMERLSKHPHVRVLGPEKGSRLAIVPFVIDGLHHDFASILLDHLFGIQNRSGCSCAGPYGHRLLNIPLEVSSRYRHWVQRGINGIKPGWVRLSLPWYATAEDLEFLYSAIEFVADHGKEFVPLYRFRWRSAGWCAIEESGGRGSACDDRPMADAERIFRRRLCGAEPAPDGTQAESLSEEQIRECRAEYFRDAKRAAAGRSSRALGGNATGMEPVDRRCGTGLACLVSLCGHRRTEDISDGGHFYMAQPDSPGAADSVAGGTRVRQPAVHFAGFEECSGRPTCGRPSLGHRDRSGSADRAAVPAHPIDFVVPESDF